MIDDELSELPPTALRDHSGDPRIERVWQRLDQGLGRPRARARAGLWLAPAFGLALFVAGVMVGRHADPTRMLAPQMAAEPLPAAESPVAAEGPARSLEHSPRPQPSARGEVRRALRPRVPGAEPLAASSEVVYEGPSATPYVVPATEPPQWQQKADSGDFPGARAALERSGGWEVALVAASPDQLMTLVDVARASGEREQAVRALRRLLDAFSGAPEASLAAWTLGNLLEQGGDRSGAAEAYATYRRLSPTGDFAEDAAARQVDVALSQGNQELASQLVDQYAKDFPNGRRLAEWRDELAKLSAERADAGVATSPEPPAAEPSAVPAPQPTP
ncbi:MAG TPA: tetratricopeptide repeat protein [Polyangiaceae bacterium]|jgi:hypothetical protein|nr:tetratricopeptide repeat protein [Polyangiaceae bacterium]